MRRQAVAREREGRGRESLLTGIPSELNRQKEARSRASGNAWERNKVQGLEVTALPLPSICADGESQDRLEQCLPFWGRGVPSFLWTSGRTPLHPHPTSFPTWCGDPLLR